MTIDTPPPVGTMLRWNHTQTEVLLSSHEYMVTRDEDGWRRALQLINGKWYDNSNNVWNIVTPELPTLPVGTVLRRIGLDRVRTVERSTPGFVYANDGSDSYAMVYVDGGWRSFQSGPLWTADC